MACSIERSCAEKSHAAWNSCGLRPSVPGTILCVYYGKLVGDVAALASGVAPERDTSYYAWLGLGLAATVAVTALVTRIARRALAEAAEIEESPS